MLTDLTPQPADQILMLMAMFRDDPREEKVDLGVGVYRDADGHTPVMGAVKIAERRLWETQATKAYTGLTGDPAFAAAMRRLVLGDAVPAARVAAAATPGGTGAVHQALLLARAANAGATVWMSRPTWPNHPSIVRHLGLAAAEYRYFDPATGAVDHEGMRADLGRVARGDVVLLHGCCHNPTGANLAPSDWAALARLIEERGATAMVDIAYQGFGDGLDADAQGLQTLAAALPELLIAASCSKNFGVYRERAGIVMAVAPDATTRSLAQDSLAHLNRQTYSFPPDHGARVVQTILDDDALRANWQAELEAMRRAMLDNRTTLARALRDATGSDRFGFLAGHRGMFSLTGATPDQVARMRDHFGVYMVGDGRMNVAGLNPGNIDRVARALAACC